MVEETELAEPTLSIFLVCSILLWMVCSFPIIYMKDDPHIYHDHLCFFLHV